MYDPREQKKAPEIEKKSFAATQSFADYLYAGGNTDLSVWVMIQMYEDAAPLFDAIDRLAKGVSSVPIRLRDKKTKEYVNEHPVLDLLRQPNGDTTGRDFMHQLSSFYSITGNVFMYGSGPVENPPLELAVIPTQTINFGATARQFGILNVADQLNVSQSSGIQMQFFSENSEKDNLIRFFNRGRDAEMWHVRRFSPRRSGSRFWGMSKAKPLFLEIQQYLSGNNTNWSMLKRGTKLSLAWVNNRGEELTTVQWDRLQQEAQKYAGDMNAGGTPILDGMDVKAIQQTNRDMEFKDLQVSMAKHIYNVYGTPLALVLDGSMTMNNLEVAIIQWFDNGVLPETSELFEELGNFLLPKYDDTENLEFCYSENDIPALRARIVASALTQKSVEVNTTNEIRAIMGDEALSNGGDTVMVDSNKIPLGEDGFTSDNPKVPVEQQKFVELMRDLKDDSGNQRYSDIEIKKMADERGL